MPAAGDGSRCAVVVEPLPRGFQLGAAVCSYGFAMLAPNVWRPPPAKKRRGGFQRQGELLRPLRRSDGSPIDATVRQPAARRLEVHVPAGTGRLSAADVAALRGQVVRMLRLSDADSAVAESFAAGSPDLAAQGAVGRLFRSPCMFEDLVKTFTLCNCGWARSLTMNEAMCAKIGRGAFPSASEMAKVSSQKLRSQCGVGYRAERILRLAREVTKGKLDLSVLENAESAEDAEKTCSAIFGLGPFGVANALQLLGHYGQIAADSETARHLRQARGLRACTVENVRQRAAQVYAGYAPLQFLRYWTELWRTYEDRMGGRASEVAPEQYRLLTAAHMKVPRQPYADQRLARQRRKRRRDTSVSEAPARGKRRRGA